MQRFHLSIALWLIALSGAAFAQQAQQQSDFKPPPEYTGPVPVPGYFAHAGRDFREVWKLLHPEGYQGVPMVQPVKDPSKETFGGIGKVGTSDTKSQPQAPAAKAPKPGEFGSGGGIGTVGGVTTTTDGKPEEPKQPEAIAPAPAPVAAENPAPKNDPTPSQGAVGGLGSTGGAIGGTGGSIGTVGGIGGVGGAEPAKP